MEVRNELNFQDLIHCYVMDAMSKVTDCLSQDICPLA